MALSDTGIRKALAAGVWKAYRDGKRIWADDLKLGQNSVAVY